MKCQIVIAGVGGQGVLFGAKVLTELARRRGIPVLASENHGMSQRGGSVTSHLRIGDFQGPLVAEGDADLLLALDCLEAHRNLPFLRAANGRRGALCLVSAPSAAAFPDARVAPTLQRMGVEIHSCAADSAALEMGQPLAANLVLLGFGAKLAAFPFSFDELCEAVAALGSPNNRAANREALVRGSRLPDLACGNLAAPANAM